MYQKLLNILANTSPVLFGYVQSKQKRLKGSRSLSLNQEKKKKKEMGPQEKTL